MFKWCRFTGASGLELDYKIICDEFTDEDWDCLAQLVIQKMRAEGHIFDFAVGVPSGGIPFASAVNRVLKEHRIGHAIGGKIIVCEDVWTTGGSTFRFIERERLVEYLPMVWTVFARGPISYRVRALFHTEESILNRF